MVIGNHVYGFCLGDIGGRGEKDILSEHSGDLGYGDPKGTLANILNSTDFFAFCK